MGTHASLLDLTFPHEKSEMIRFSDFLPFSFYLPNSTQIIYSGYENGVLLGDLGAE